MRYGNRDVALLIWIVLGVLVIGVIETVGFLWRWALAP